MRRHDEGRAPQHRRESSRLRAIRHNTTLQQLGFPAKAPGGARAAVAEDAERFRSLYAESERFRRRVAVIEHVFQYADAALLRGRVDLRDRAM
ncbi:MAG: hypothetical protein ACLFU0_08205 [Alphaproteobacteria bacterium]